MINWAALGIEFVVSLVSAAGAVSIFALGLRMLAVGAPPHARLSAATEQVADGEVAVSHQRPPWASAAAYLCFAIDIAVVLFGLYLLIPQFH
ncbi:hypothetical protein ACFOYW_02600 [Gryllotalpicola reticulitermitis]|uniref:Uncharacterized protein n=1 Tax=Gryllotalpicola reticulitermitis TaxID=1184153 RepID=A0ABV8Q3I6_9MICO